MLFHKDGLQSISICNKAPPIARSVNNDNK